MPRRRRQAKPFKIHDFTVQRLREFASLGSDWVQSSEAYSVLPHSTLENLVRLGYIERQGFNWRCRLYRITDTALALLGTPIGGAK